MGVRDDKFNDYEGFVEKFKPKKTTDDCMTPPEVYEVVAEFVSTEYGVNREKFVRPFFPGTSYTDYDYPDGCIVVDNPPFSILTQIIRWYNARGIQYFLFAPALTGIKPECCSVFANATIIYENGAKIRTSFLTNLDTEHAVVTAPRLSRALKALRQPKPKTRYTLPANILTGARLDMISGDIELKLDKDRCAYVKKLDNLTDFGSRSIYGGGYMVPDEVKERYAWRLPANEELPVVELSARERKIIEELGA